MKKTISCLLAGSLLLTLAGCGSNAVSSANTQSSQATTAAAADTDLSAAAVSFVFSDSGITADGDSSGYTIDGTSLTISQSGVYSLSGSCSSGSIKVKADTTDVTLILNGLTLNGNTTAAILCGKSSGVQIEAAAGTVNILTDSEQNNKDAYSDNEDAENAVIKCKDGSQVVLCGSGTLQITANGKNGIKSGAENEADSREASLTIRDLTLDIDAPVNDAINAEQLLNVESGTLTIAAGDDAVHCDLTLNIGAEGTDGPNITITTCYEGLEGADLNVYSGNINITSTDDCLNAANSDLSGYAFTMNLAGGKIYAYSTSGDGFDSNGSMTISGSDIMVYTANTADNEPLDADGVITVTGGTILAAGGSAGMGASYNAEQAYVTFGGTGGMGGMGGFGGQSAALIADGSSFSITDADGNALYTGTAPCGINYLFYSAPELADESEYTLSAGESSSTSTAQTGESSTGFGPGGTGQMPGGQRPDGTDGQNGPMPGNEDRQPPEMSGDRPQDGSFTPPDRPNNNDSDSSSTQT